MSINISYNENNITLKELILIALNKHSPVKVTNEKGESVYVVSKDDYEAMEETFYLLKDPQNSSRILNSLSEKSVSFDSIKDLKNEAGL